MPEEKLKQETENRNEIAEEKKENIKTIPQFKIFDLYDITSIKVEDLGLQRTINLEPKLVLRNQGRNVEKYGQAKVNIVERLINRIATAGHRGKKHRVILGHSTGKFSKNTKIVLEAFKLIEKRTGKNPVEVFVKAVENSSPRDEVTTIEYGGARYPQSVDVSPIRRVNLALRWIVHGASDKAFNKKKTIAQSLAEEIVLASEANGESFAVRKKKESEAQADSAR
ncbi:30S ribosomal protein S7 [Candidatus Pacearchaeota archaeon]|nr:30S ribosomal protein S7 [Candidatus Pacearchaeota archaeon]